MSAKQSSKKIGWLLLAGIGGIVGIVSFLVQNKHKLSLKFFKNKVSRDFALTFTVLVAAVMKSDGKPMKSELEYVRQFYIKNFGEDVAREAMLMLRNLLKSEIPLQKVGFQIRQKLMYPARLQLLHFLFLLSTVDKPIQTVEISTLEDISRYIGIHPRDFNSIKAMFYNDLQAAYTVLEIEKNATNEQVKKAYRKMAMQYHPDKLESLGQSMQETATVRFQKVKEAYERIKTERGMS